MREGRPIRDLTGQKFGAWKVLRLSDRRPNKKMHFGCANARIAEVFTQ